MRILFIDIDYHRKTRSADFFLEILRTAFDVDTHYYFDCYSPKIPRDKIARADVVVVWQDILGRRDFVIPGKPCVLVPMYDSDWGSRAMWRRIARSGTHVISFSEAISLRATRAKIPPERLLDIRFAFDPDLFKDAEGNPRVAALWERGPFGVDTIKRLFPPGLMKKITLFRRPQPGLAYEPIAEDDKRDYGIEVDDRPFIPKDEYLALARQYGVYIAPRPREGIGMSFLEQIAMGKCVIAHDDNTMNEYIVNDGNGILRNLLGDFAPVTIDEIDAARKGVKESARKAYSRWLSNKKKIVPFINAAAMRSPVKIGGVIDLSLRLLYILEAALSRFRSFCLNL